MENRYVSRGGLKLEHALKQFRLDVRGLTVLDAGSSTGGFVDCLLSHGAKKVYAVDTAYGELAWKLRNDSRVVVMERENILYLEALPEKVDLITLDVTFTSLTKILPVVKKFGGQIVALVKPQYEDSKLALKHGGIIPKSYQPAILDNLKEFLATNNFKLLAETPSPILGGEGNTEYFFYLE